MVYKVPDVSNKLNKNQQHLVSWVIDISNNHQDITSYFYQGEQMKDKARFFWSTPDESFVLVGLGSCLDLIGKDYQEMLNYQTDMKNQVITNCQIAATGPIIFGGFPFDKRVQKTSVWQNIGSGYFLLPTFLVTKYNETYYLTINMFVSSEVELKEKWQTILAKWKKINQPFKKQNQQNTVIDSTESNIDTWLNTVKDAIFEINSHTDIQKIVLARQLNVNMEKYISVNDVMSNLLKQQKNTYCFALVYGEETFIGATPERLLCSDDKTFSTACVAGSIPRGKTKEEDDYLGRKLLDDMKNQHEHQVVVDAIEKEMQRITKTLSEKNNPSLLKNRDIQHLYFPFVGEKREQISFFEAISYLHPTPALGGEPKNATLDWLREHENMNRGLYGAPIGWNSLLTDTGEFAVGIRSAYILKNKATLFAGCGIVKDSIPEEELIETRVKFNPMLRALGGKPFVSSK